MNTSINWKIEETHDKKKYDEISVKSINKVAIYARLSKEDYDKQDLEESESIQNQKSLLVEYALAKNWDIHYIYVDDDRKGTDRNRPEFLEMIKDAKKKKFDIILCKSQSRFSRELETIEKYLHHLFIEWNIRFVSVVDNIDTHIKGNKKTRQILGLTNEWYLEDLSDNIRSVLDVKRKKGEYIASWALYGYMKSPDDKNKLIVDEEAASVVREIYNLYLLGNGCQRIAKILNQRKIPNPYTYKKLNGEKINPPNLTKKSAYWTSGTIYNILKNRTYTGDLVQGRFKKASYKSKKLLRTPKEEWFICENTHKGIIDKEKYLMVQKILGSRTKPAKSGKVHIFSKKIRCLECGEFLTLSGVGKNSRNESVRYLVCSNRKVNKDNCVGASIAYHNLETYVLNQVNNMAKMYFDINTIGNEIKLNDELSDKLAMIKKSLNELNKKAEERESAIKSLYLDKVKGLISTEQFLSLNKQLLLDIENIQTQIEIKQKAIYELKEIQSKRCDPKDIISKYQSLNQLSREVITELIDVVYVGAKDRKNGERCIKIIWNF